MRHSFFTSLHSLQLSHRWSFVSEYSKVLILRPHWTTSPIQRTTGNLPPTSPSTSPETIHTRNQPQKPRIMSHYQESHQDDVVTHTLKELASSTQSTFTKADLEGLGISVKEFDPLDPDFLDNRKKCLFKPYDKEDLKRWKIPASEAAYESVHNRLNIQDVPLHSRLASEPTEAEIMRATRAVMRYLQTHFTFRCEGRTKRLLSDEFGWAEIECVSLLRL